MARYGGPNVKRAQNLIVNDEGAFAAPAHIDERPYENMLPLDDRTASAARPLGGDFVYDDDPAWDQPLVTIPVQERAVPSRRAAPQEADRHIIRSGDPRGRAARGVRIARCAVGGKPTCMWR